MSIIMRHGSHDFEVLEIATAMEEAGAQVISVFRTKPGHEKSYVVMARFDPTQLSPDDIDLHISAALHGSSDAC